MKFFVDTLAYIYCRLQLMHDKIIIYTYGEEMFYFNILYSKEVANNKIDTYYKKKTDLNYRIMHYEHMLKNKCFLYFYCF